MPLFEAYRGFYRCAPDPARARAFLRDRLAAGQSAIFIARDPSGTPLGFTQLYPLFSSLRMRPIWLLNDLFVASTARGRGVGTALLRAAESFGRANGAAYLELATGIDNERAQRVYEATGWLRETDTYRYGRQLDGGPCELG